MATQLTSFIPDVAVKLPGCPKIIIQHYLLNVIREFSSKTLINNSWIDLSITSGNKEYSLSAPSNTEIVDVIRVVYDDSDEQDFNDYYYLADSFWLTYEPTDDFDLDVLVGLRPVSTVTEVDDFYYNDWLDTIVDGVVYKLASMNKKDWSDPALAQVAFNNYFIGINKAKALVYERLFNNTGTTIQKSFI